MSICSKCKQPWSLDDQALRRSKASKQGIETRRARGEKVGASFKYNWQEIIDFKISNPTFGYKRIAKHFGCSETTAYQAIKSDERSRALVEVSKLARHEKPKTILLPKNFKRRESKPENLPLPMGLQA